MESDFDLNYIIREKLLKETTYLLAVEPILFLLIYNCKDKVNMVIALMYVYHFLGSSKNENYVSDLQSW